MQPHSALHAMAAPRRQEILRLLWDGELSASAVREQMRDVTFGAVSQHLRLLEQAGLVRVREEGRFRYYTADKDALGPLRPWLEQMWDEALWSLKVRAEMEQARRGPRAGHGKADS